jgi:hypothetical protein
MKTIELTQNSIIRYSIFDLKGRIMFYLPENGKYAGRYMGWKKLCKENIKAVENWIREGYLVKIKYQEGK